MERKGKTLKVLPDGAPRRLADGRNAWRKMSSAQRSEFLEWAWHEKLTIERSRGMAITREGRES